MEMQKNRIGWFGICFIGCLVSNANAEMFKCADSPGVVTFSDKPCATGTNQEVVDMRYKRDYRPAPLPAASGVKVMDGKAPLVPVTPEISASSSQRAPVVPAAPKRPLEDRLADLCVDQYRPHLAYPNGVRIRSRTLERRLDEMVMTVYVRTITNNHTPRALETITIDEKFVCVTDHGEGLNVRSTGMWVERHKRGQRL